MSNDMRYRTGRHDALQGRAMVAMRGEEYEQGYLAGLREKATVDDMVLCESPDGWSLHAPGSTDEEIATGDAPYILNGPGKPSEADYANAFKLWREKKNG